MGLMILSFIVSDSPYTFLVVCCLLLREIIASRVARAKLARALVAMSAASEE